MSQQGFIDLATQAIYTAALVGGPALAISLVVGLMISIFQAVTQINEATLTFIPKIVAVGAALVLLGPWMLRVLIDFTSGILLQMAHLH